MREVIYQLDILVMFNNIRVIFRMSQKWEVYCITQIGTELMIQRRVVAGNGTICFITALSLQSNSKAVKMNI